MINPEFTSLPIEEVETANYLFESTDELDRRIHQRITLEHAGIPITSVPIGGGSKTDQLVDFLGNAIYGLALTIKDRPTTKGEFKILSQYTDGMNDDGFNDIWREIEQMGIPVVPELELPNKKQRLASAGHALATLSVLGNQGHVSYQALGLNKRTSDRPTQWKRRLPLTEAFALLNDLRNNTDIMINSQNPIQDTLGAYRTGHFHAMSALLARQLYSYFLKPH